MSHTDENMKPTTEVGEKADIQAASVETRRRLLKGGLAGAPVLMTLASRPAHATGAVCATPSGYYSAQTFHSHNPQNVTCTGLTPGYWKTHIDPGDHPYAWPSPYIPTTTFAPPTPATKFNDVFGSNPFPANVITLLDVLNQGGGGAIAVGRHIVAALLNAKSGTATVLTVAQVLAIWANFASSGFVSYQVSPGVIWSASQLDDYLVTTQTV